jgi:WD40 repeat protein
LVCIKENRTEVATYDDGQPGYLLDWDVRLIKLSNGQVIGTKKFKSDFPPIPKWGGGPAYGRTPYEQYLKWLLTALGDRTILVDDDGVESVAFSPDGKILAAGSQNGTVKC